MATLNSLTRLAGMTAMLTLASGCALMPSFSGKKIVLANTVTRPPDYPGKLRSSEVPLRGLLPRPIGANDPENTLDAIRDFHATRLEWIYDLNPEFVAKVKALGVTVSGAVNTGTQQGYDLTKPEILRSMAILDLEGRPVFAPWMREWKPPGRWLCVNNPKVRDAYLTALEHLVDLGVKDIQRDDPAGNAAAAAWGACFCDYCVAGFRKYLATRLSAADSMSLGIDLGSFDYRAYLLSKEAPVGDGFAKYNGGPLQRLFRDFQESSTIDFHQWWRDALNQYAKRVFPVSANVVDQPDDKIARLFDFWIGELPMRKATPEALLEISRRVRGRQILTMPLHAVLPVEPVGWIALTRRSLATSYALGMLMEAPWDTYLPTPEAERHFGKPSDYADLYALVRAASVYVYGYVEAAVMEKHFSKAVNLNAPAPVELGSSASELLVVARVKPQNPAAPVVIHLVDWSETPETVQLGFDRRVIFAGRPFHVELLTAKEYELGAHRQAFERQDYTSLINRVILEPNPDGSFTVPPLHLWGLLILTSKDNRTRSWRINGKN